MKKLLVFFGQGFAPFLDACVDWYRHYHPSTVEFSPEYRLQSKVQGAFLLSKLMPSIDVDVQICLWSQNARILRQDRWILLLSVSITKKVSDEELLHVDIYDKIFVEMLMCIVVVI
jgi:hypothetical protein